VNLSDKTLKDRPAEPHPQTINEKYGNMSGAEAIGLIGFAITAIDTSIQIYKAVSDRSGIPEKLRKVSDKLPALSELLQGAQSQIDKAQPTGQTWRDVMKAIQDCRDACEDLHGLLDSVYPKADAGTTARVFKSMSSMISNKSKTAEELLKDIHGYLEILKHRQIITNAETLDDIKRTVDELFPISGITQNNGSGTNIAHNNGQVNNLIGSGKQFNGSNGTYYFDGK